MKTSPHFKLLILTLLIMSNGCSPTPRALPSSRRSTPISIPSSTPLKAAEVTITIITPKDTPSDADLALVLIDEVTGFAYNTHSLPMTRLKDGRWQVSFTPPVGSLLRYHYRRRSPSPADEVTTEGAVIPYRVVYIPGPIQIDDIIASWADSPHHGSTGRIIGRITNANTGQPLSEILVSVAGLTNFTDGEGAFRFDGLPPGLHNLVVFSPDGAYHTIQQGAIVAAESMTPVDLSVLPAKAVNVTFEVTVPDDTLPGNPVRMAGNVQQLGHMFSELTGGLSVANSHMPTLTHIDPTHYLTVITLYEGTDLHYKYTLGDALWNAERDNDGFFHIRHLIVPNHDLVVEDTVMSWHGGVKDSLNFHLIAPGNTPLSDYVSIQFKSLYWLEPLPMRSLGKNEWLFTLHSPLDFNEPLVYRYCRNSQCGSADDTKTAGPNAIGRQVTPEQVAPDIEDEVKSWKWWDTVPPSVAVIGPEISSRADFLAGVAFLPAYKPNWMTLYAEAITSVSDLDANSLIMTPTWVLDRNNPTPSITFNPTYAPFSNDLLTLNNEAVRSGLEVTLRPSLRTIDGEIDAWWFDATRDSTWWAVWFEEYRSFILSYARQAQKIGANTLVIGGPEIRPALPGGLLSDGTPSGSPYDAEARWRRLIKEVRARFSGQLAFEIDLGTSLQNPPIFIDDFDQVHIYWHAPLTDSHTVTVANLHAAAGALFDETILVHPELADKPIILSVEYLSVVKSVEACVKSPNGSCRVPSAFDEGAVVDQDLELDLIGQAHAINAVLLEASKRPEVIGFYVRGYNPTAALLDKSASINGKPSRDVLSHLYQQITGQH